MTAQGSYSDADLINGVRLAMKAGDMQAVVDIMRLLAVQNPRQAADLLDVVKVGLAMHKGAR